MPRPKPSVVKISSPSDVIAAVTQMLGFMPTESVVAACTHGKRCRFGLTMRFDLEVADDIEWFAATIAARTRRERADGVFIVVFTDSPPVDGILPRRALVEQARDRQTGLVIDAFLVTADRWWSYLCEDPDCCPPEGSPIDPQSPGATALAAAYALAGQGVLPDRDAVVRSVGYDGREAEAMTERIVAALGRHEEESQFARRRAVRMLVERLMADLVDPRASIDDVDAAELAALCADAIVRDEVLVCGLKVDEREVLLRVLHHVVPRIPPPYDASICATLAWTAYANGDGAIANVALDRVFATDPDYSLALLIADSLDRQVPPGVLEEVMREAARDLHDRSAAG